MIITLAVISYAIALVCDCEQYPEQAIPLKLATTGCVGLWNAMQVVRLHPQVIDLMRCRSSFSAADLETKVAFTAFFSYCLGALTGFGGMSCGVFIKFVLNASPEQLAPYITLAFLLSHIGNLIRTQCNSHALVLEKNYVRCDVVFYLFALFSDFFPQYQLQELGVLAKLASAGCMGLWNTAHTWRVHPAVYDFFAYVRHPECSEEAGRSLAALEMTGEGSTSRNYHSISGRHSIFTYGRAVTILPEESFCDAEGGYITSSGATLV